MYVGSTHYQCHNVDVYLWKDRHGYYQICMEYSSHPAGYISKLMTSLNCTSKGYNTVDCDDIMTDVSEERRVYIMCLHHLGLHDLYDKRDLPIEMQMDITDKE